MGRRERLLEALDYVKDEDGRLIDLRWLKPAIAAHLEAAGADIHPELATIKKRPIHAPGVFDDAVDWVPVDAPDPPSAPPGITLAELPEPDMAALPWALTPDITFDDEES